MGKERREEMKYSVEYENGIFTETLTVNGHEVRKLWKREDGGEFEQLCTKNRDFSEQLKEQLDEEVCNSIYEFFDESNMMVADIEDFIAMNDVK